MLWNCRHKVFILLFIVRVQGQKPKQQANDCGYPSEIFCKLSHDKEGTEATTCFVFEKFSSKKTQISPSQFLTTYHSLPISLVCSRWGILFSVSSLMSDNELNSIENLTHTMMKKCKNEIEYMKKTRKRMLKTRKRQNYKT